MVVRQQKAFYYRIQVRNQIRAWIKTDLLFLREELLESVCGGTHFKVLGERLWHAMHHKVAKALVHVVGEDSLALYA